MKKLLLLSIIPLFCFAQKDYPGSSLKQSLNSLKDKNINAWSTGCDEENPFIICYLLPPRTKDLHLQIEKLASDISVKQVILDGIILTKVPTLNFTAGQIVMIPKLTNGQYVFTVSTLNFEPKPNERAMTGFLYNVVLHASLKPPTGDEFLKILLDGYQLYVPKHATNKKGN